MTNERDVVLRAAKSGLTRADVTRLRLRYLKPTETSRLTEGRHPLAAMKIPYFDSDGQIIKDFWRLRMLEERATFGQKTVRYTQPADAAPRLYLPPLEDWSGIVADAGRPIAITEGELKAACATRHVIPTIGLGGVWNWRSRKKRQPLLPDFDWFVWKGRIVYITFDSDLRTNPHVRAALTAICFALTHLGADVYVVYLPDVPGLVDKTGLDDYITAIGADAFKGLLENAEPFGPSRKLHELNTEVAYVENPGLIVRLSDGFRYRPSDFMAHAYAHRSYVVYENDRPRTKPLARAWIAWPGRAALTGFTYAPGGDRITRDGAYNTWPGWGVEPARGDIAPWRELMAHVFGDDRVARRWFERWCAVQFQQPGVKLYTAVLLWSIATGTGKSLVGVTLGKIFGRNFVELNSTHLMSQFNGWIESKQFALGDEITGNDSRAFADLLKAMVTRTTVHINAKYMPTYETPDRINYLFTSNHPDALFLDDADRRYFVHEIRNGPIDTAWAARYHEWLHNGPGPAALFDYFLRVDLGDFLPTDRAPVTAARAEMVYGTQSDVDRWAMDAIADPDAVLGHGGASPVADLWTPAQLIDLYDPLRRHRVTLNTIGRAFTRAGAYRFSPIRCGGATRRLYALKNIERWRRAKPREVAAHWDAHFSHEQKWRRQPEKKKKTVK